MYVITVLPHGVLTFAGKPAITTDREFENAAVIKAVFPFSLVAEFDSWLATAIEPLHLERPDKAISEYSDPMSGFADVPDLHVIYYAVVDNSKLEEVERFADSYTDKRD